MAMMQKKLGHRRIPSDMTVFKELTRKDAEKMMWTEIQRLLMTAKNEDEDRTKKELTAFQNLFSRYLDGIGKSIEWDKIHSLPETLIRPYELLPSVEDANISSILNQMVVLKLNGGLGTSMGCTGPKSLICVRNDLTFLDLTIQQIEQLNHKYKCAIPLVLMNSFNTHEDTERVLRKYHNVDVNIYTFLQSRYPRINRESLLPVITSIGRDEEEGWYPPGHGDVYRSFLNSGLLDSFLKMGKRWVFISNIDNLGATVDLSILNFLANPAKPGEENGSSPENCEFLMEVTDKTRADVKGGTLVEYEGRLRLLEIAQVPRDHVDDFTSIRKFKIFNTNNLWISLSAIKRVIEDEKLEMEVIVNPKTLDNGVNVVQLEEAVGAAIRCFDGAMSVNVPRRRFLPVKTSSDLLLMMSNLYKLQAGHLAMSPLRSFPSVPLVKLGTHFKKVKDFLHRFLSIPDILELDHLTVSGDVTFGKGVSLKGTVIIIANHGDRIDIPSGAILENKIVSGNLRILDH